MTFVWSGKKVLVTGGCGFVGSNLVSRLVSEGAKVSVVDALIPDLGGNLYNLEPVMDGIVLNVANICDENAMNHLVQNKDFIFHLAAQVSHVLSMSNPFPDVDYNVKGTTVLLEACRKYNPSARIIYTGTRGQYGQAKKLPVCEDAPQNPLALYELTKKWVEELCLLYRGRWGADVVLARLTNIYGPRSQMKSNKFGVLNWFVRLALDDETIPIYGSGNNKRDFLYVDDCVDALLLLAESGNTSGEIFNIGRDDWSTFLDAAEIIMRIAGKGRMEFVEFDQQRKPQEPGDFYSDISKIKKYVGWTPKVGLEEGINQTIEFYRRERSHYW